MKLKNEQYTITLQLAVAFINLDKLLGKEIKYENLDSYISKAFTTSSVEYDEEDYAKLFKDLEYQFAIQHTPGQCIFDDYENINDWYHDDDIEEPFFWNRYKRYLREKSSIDLKSIELLGNKTLPELMNCLSDPHEEFEGIRLKRGLIIGDVQSGKTATYIGLICKAADAGYKVIILLAGITESLREQTQERIDEGVVGYSIRIVDKMEKRGFVGVGLDHKPRRATSFTSCAKDFIGDCDKISTTLAEHNSIVLFVVKKNVSVLTKLYNWLKDNNLDVVEKCVPHPMLLIDDEADNASVNTRKDETDPTKTNKIIRNICCLFKNASYVGFTATPFANVFIDPDSVDSMKQADLFPEHFIYTLPTPSSYIGPQKIFYDGSKYNGNLRYIIDIDEPDYTSEEYKYASKYDTLALNNGAFYYRHTKDWNGALPDSLRESVLCFFLANVIRDLRGQKSKPRGMLINMSRFIKVQNVIKEHIDDIYNNFVNTVRYDFSENCKANEKLSLYKELYDIWIKHFNNITDISFKRVVNKDAILNAVGNIERMVVNGGKNSGKLDYKSYPSLRVIAIGGMALSRGLTLEGLMVSYFYRNTATFDVLMQMGRWFGYRPGYDDLFQIWTSQTSANWYQEIAIASEELKSDIKMMYEQHLTPKDFGIRVRDYCDELQITARNKMHYSYDLLVLESYYGNIYDTPYISRNIENNRENWEQVKKLTENLLNRGFTLKPTGEYKNPDEKSQYFSDVPKSTIQEFLSEIKCSLVNMRFNTSQLLDFIGDQETVGLEKWDVVFEGGNGNVYYDIPGLENIRCAKRAIEEHENVIQISSRRRILSLREGKFTLSTADVKIAEEKCRDAWRKEDENSSEASIMSRSIPLKAYFKYLPKRKPILIIMLIEPNKPEEDKSEGKKISKFREELDKNLIVAFAIGFPGVKETEKTKKYKVNKQYFELNMQDDEPDEIEAYEE
jgi:hypothetical protein